MEWKIVHGGQPDIKPKEIMFNFDSVYLRRNIHKHEQNNVMGDGDVISDWEYEEAVITKDEYETFVRLLDNPFFSSKANELSDRLSDLEEFVTTLTE